MTTLREQVEANTARNTAELKEKIHNEIQRRPAWEQVVSFAQQSSKDADLMARLSC